MVAMVGVQIELGSHLCKVQQSKLVTKNSEAPERTAGLGGDDSDCDEERIFKSTD
jgi:hypothetical protein